MRSLALALALGSLPGALAAQWAAPPGVTVRNAFGPTIGTGAIPCRGACGASCPPTCDVSSYWDCSDPWIATKVTVYDCGTHRGCREHDDCLDECSRRYPGSGRSPATGDEWRDHLLGEEPGEILDGWRPLDRNFYFGECSLDCHLQGIEDFGLESTNSWRQGLGPFDGRTVFEYTRDVPGGPEELFHCEEGEELVCTRQAVSCRPDDDREIDIAADRSCVPAGESETLSAVVRGLDDRRVRWRVEEGPATVDAGGTLRPTGDGRARVVAQSVVDPKLRDTLEIAVGRCGCAFTATLAGDTRRGTVEGAWANFSTRGQATILGGSSSPEALEDLARLMGAAQPGEDGAPSPLAQAMERLAARRRADAASAGSTVGLSLVEARPGRIGPAPGGGLGTAFKLDVLANASIEPGFSGTLPVHNLVLHTGEFAAEGGGPMLYRWSAGEPGSVLLHLSRYDGSWLEGSVVAELEGVAGLMKSGGGKPRVQVRADFRAGAFNPLRFENVCAFAQIGE